MIYNLLNRVLYTLIYYETDNTLIFSLIFLYFCVMIKSLSNKAFIKNFLKLDYQYFLIFKAFFCSKN
jgi:hypothetical protein